MKNKFNLYLIILVLLGTTVTSCKKDAGSGGDSSITGRVFVENYNSSFTSLVNEYNAGAEDVYIIFGNDLSYGAHAKTSYDGMYDFKYLQPGKYKVFAYSKDSAGLYKNQQNLNAPKIAIIKEVEITKSKETLNLDNIVILK